MNIYGLTDIGIHRKDNQDNYWASILEVNGVEVGVLCLCDGMGGLDNGAEASKYVIERIRDSLIEDFNIFTLGDKIRDAGIDLMKKYDKKSGTTCTLVICKEGVYSVYHIGDSRCYKKTKDGVYLLTEDHTVVNKYEKAGVKGEQLEKIKKKYKNVLMRCLGIVPDSVLDFSTGTYQPGDLFLVCSDGFWHYLKVADFKNGSLSNTEELSKTIKRFISFGELDNITVGILEV